MKSKAISFAVNAVSSIRPACLAPLHEIVADTICESRYFNLTKLYRVLGKYGLFSTPRCLVMMALQFLEIRFQFSVEIHSERPSEENGPQSDDARPCGPRRSTDFCRRGSALTRPLLARIIRLQDQG
jgi:hypothetical protein